MTNKGHHFGKKFVVIILPFCIVFLKVSKYRLEYNFK